MAISNKTTDYRYRLALVPLLIAAWPLLTVCLWLNYASVILLAQRRRFDRTPIQPPRASVLLTGASNAYGLNLARAFSKLGYRVIGADLTETGLPSAAKWSRAVTNHYDIPALSAVRDANYVARCIHVVVRKEAIGLWINCSDDIPVNVIATAKAEIEEKSTCRCFAASIEETATFGRRDSFLSFLRENNLPSPEAHRVSSRKQIHNVLNQAQGKKQYLLTSPSKGKDGDSKTLLPRRTLSQTYHDISLVKLNTESQMVLEELVDTTTSFHCLVLINGGVVTAFHARKESFGKLEILPSETALCQAMNRYTTEVARSLGSDCSTHLMLRFGLTERITHAGVVQQVLPVEARLGIDPSFVLSISKQGFLEMAKSYQNSSHNGNNRTDQSISLRHETISEPFSSRRLGVSAQQYLIADDVITLLLQPSVGLWHSNMKFRDALKEFLRDIALFVYHMLFLKEAVYDFWDPLPAYWRYAIALPLLTMKS